MAKRHPAEDRAMEVLWKRLPESDRRFINAMMVVSEIIGDRTLRYHLLPAGLQRTLHQCDRNALFSVITDCFGLLLDAPVLKRIQSDQRPTGKSPSAPVKKRTTARKKKRAKRAAPARPKTKRSRST